MTVKELIKVLGNLNPDERVYFKRPSAVQVDPAFITETAVEIDEVLKFPVMAPDRFHQENWILIGSYETTDDPDDNYPCPEFRLFLTEKGYFEGCYSYHRSRWAELLAARVQPAESRMW